MAGNFSWMNQQNQQNQQQQGMQTDLNSWNDISQQERNKYDSGTQKRMTAMGQGANALNQFDQQNRQANTLPQNQFQGWMKNQQNQQQQGQMNSNNMPYNQWRGTGQPQGQVQAANYGSGGQQPFNLGPYAGDSGYGIGQPSNNGGGYSGPPVPNMPQLDYGKFLAGGNFGNTLGVNGGFDLNAMLLGNGAFDIESYLDDEKRPAIKGMGENSLFPYAQHMSNEDQRNFEKYMLMQNFNATMGMNTFNMGQQGWQNDYDNRTMTMMDDQFNKTLGLDSRVANDRYGAGGIEATRNKNDRYETDQATVRGRLRNQNQLDVQDLINSGQLGAIGAQGIQDKDLRKMIEEGLNTRNKDTLANQLTQSRYQTFGRSQAPNMRMSANWG